MGTLSTLVVPQLVTRVPLVPVARQELHLYPDPREVVAVPLDFGTGSGTRDRVERALAVSDAVAAEWLSDTAAQFDDRHRDLAEILVARWEQLVEQLDLKQDEIDLPHRLLAAAYMTKEYAVSAAALCNPSVVVHPVQSCADGDLRVVLSLRAIGEGHRSSIIFREGTVSPSGELSLDVISIYGELGSVVSNGPNDGYDLTFADDSPLAERVIFGMLADEARGVEDARFVTLSRPDGSTLVAATFSAYDGEHVTAKLLRTTDLRSFRVDKLSGPGATDKGLAIFPRQIGGRWVAACRRDGQRMFITRSDDLVCWDEPVLLSEPKDAWELLQQGNCGSPIETDAGWLLITHGVGPMRRYTLGAMLLDLDDPSKVVARLNGKLLEPQASERDGYVPNVLYTCGAVTHNGMLILPYAHGDQACAVATVDMGVLLGIMLSEGNK